jgi:putative membrane protein
VRAVAIRIGINALAIWVAALVVPQVTVTEGSASQVLITLLLLGALFGVVNALIKPVVKFLSFPFYIITLGLFAFVVNALMLKLVEWISDPLGIGFDAGPFFWSTLAAAVVVTLVSMLASVFVPEPREQQRR